MKRLICLLVGLFLPVLSFGGSLNSVYVEDLNINRQLSQVFIRTSIPPSNQTLIACHEDSNWNFTFVIANEADKAVYSSLLSALVGKKLIDIVGTGTCPSSGYTKVEEVQWVTLFD